MGISTGTAYHWLANTETGGSLVIAHNFGEDRLLTIKEVAELTGLQVGSLYHLVSQKTPRSMP